DRECIPCATAPRGGLTSRPQGIMPFRRRGAERAQGRAQAHRLHTLTRPPPFAALRLPPLALLLNPSQKARHLASQLGSSSLFSSSSSPFSVVFSAPSEASLLPSFC